ncbi:ankyrin repeat-containing domain protein [Mycotypha africana]|uniref:ankyrin repeat-containing domain protein n=1 Tax=Mycotypha africana TaxID=64632 RepID=UPI002301FA8E|nr:ankyrin repeat-containing domain protein [Mycotypha africana]KAI8987877.1 ankyrin repeat-containing domain protein [Mycotypha africana]
MKGNLEIVQMLVESGALLDRQTKDGRTALYLAVQEGHVDVVEYLTDQYPKALLIETNSGRLPTQAAAALSSPLSKEGYEITRYLLSHSSGLTINDDGSNSLIGHRDKSGRDILLDATVSQNLELLQFLLNQGGADANDIDSLGRTMMHHAAIMGHLDVLKLLSKIEGELQWNATDTWDSWTPLMHAAKEGHEEVVRYLVEVIKVETYQKDKQGRTAKDLGICLFM